MVCSQRGTNFVKEKNLPKKARTTSYPCYPIKVPHTISKMSTLANSCATPTLASLFQFPHLAPWAVSFLMINVSILFCFLWRRFKTRYRLIRFGIAQSWELLCIQTSSLIIVDGIQGGNLPLPCLQAETPRLFVLMSQICTDSDRLLVHSHCESSTYF